jgi:hypothetical protein
LGAYGRGIKIDFPYSLLVDLRHYGNGDVYEIKPLSAYGLAGAVGEAWAYSQALNFFEKDEGPWEPASIGRTFPPLLLIVGSQWSTTGTLQVFAPPLMPPGAVIYTDNLLRDLANPKVIRAAQRFGYVLIKRLQALAPKWSQDEARARAIAIEEREELAVYTKL